VKELTKARRAKLIKLVVDVLRDAPLPAPDRGESETAFTRRCLAPLIEDTLRGLDFPGLLPLGTGGASMISCHALGSHFYPDLAVAYFGTPVFAVEVKFLRGIQRQNSIATAVGQGLLYSHRFENAAVMFIDAEGRLSDGEILASEKLLGETTFPLVVRRATRAAELSPHPRLP
jgi:hypothetical protein